MRIGPAGSGLSRDAVVRYSADLYELDGELSYEYAVRFVDVARTLNPAQKQRLAALRNLEGYTCRGACIYSETIAWPELGNTDFLFLTGRR